MNINTVIAYLAGVATPVVLFFVSMAYHALRGWRANRRYQRAWDKFTVEFDGMSPTQRRAFELTRTADSKCATERERYFAQRWCGGTTAEV